MEMELGESIDNSNNDSECWPYDSTNYVIVAALSAGLAFISILLIVGVIFIMVIFRKLQFFSQRLVLYLAIAAILVNLGIIFHRIDYQGQMSDFYVRFCSFGGYLFNTSNWILLMAVSCIVAYSAIALFFNKSTERYEFVYLFLIFVFPLLFTWIPFIGNTYGRAGAWCWIKSVERDANCTKDVLGTALQYAIWFIPLYIFLAILIVLTVMIIVKLYLQKKNWPSKSKNLKLRRDIIPLIAYPLIFIILNILPFINRIYNTVNLEPELGLWFLTAIVNPSVGAWIALAVGLDPETRKRLTFAQVKTATLELFMKNVVVQEYDMESSKDRSDSLKYSEDHPYQRYENNYKLNLSSSRNEN